MTDGHLHDTPDILEAYVLGRMIDEERRRWDEHLRVCPLCRNAVHAERLLIAGIRRAGREDVKRRLHDRLQQQDGDAVGVPWPRIFAIAAVLVMLVGVGLFGRWMYLHITPSEPMVAEQTRRTDTIAPSVEGKPSQPSGKADGGEKRNGGRSAASTRLPSEDHAAGPGSIGERPRESIRTRERAAEIHTTATLLADDALARKAETQGYTRSLHVQKNAPQSSMDTVPASPRKPAIRVLMRTATETADNAAASGSARTIPATIRHDTSGIAVTLFVPHADSLSYAGRTSVLWVSQDSIVIQAGMRRLGMKLR